MTDCSPSPDCRSAMEKRNEIEILHGGVQAPDQDPDGAAVYETAPTLCSGLLAAGQITMRKVGGRQTLTQKSADKAIDLAHRGRMHLPTRTGVRSQSVLDFVWRGLDRMRIVDQTADIACPASRR